MIDNLASSMVQKLLNADMVDFDNQDVYLYGFQLLLSTVLKSIGIIVIAYILGIVLETLLFLSTFILLRVNAGGYHAKSYLNCFVMTVIFILAGISVAQEAVNHFSVYFLILVLAITSILVYKYAPADTPNKRLSKKEIIFYRKRSRQVVLLGSLFILTLYFIKTNLLFYCNIAAMGFFIESITLVQGKIEINYFQEKGGI